MSAQMQPQQRQPGRERQMQPQPDYEPKFPGVGKLKDKVALITGGDSGIGRATALAMAREGAKLAIVYLDEHEDADETLRLVTREGSHGIKVAGDVGVEEFCHQAVQETVREFRGLDILVNNAAEQHETKDPLKIDSSELERTFRTNIFGYFFLVKAAMPHLRAGAVIINTTSITAYKGHETLLSYAATKGAIVSFTRSLSDVLVKRGIRVNAGSRPDLDPPYSRFVRARSRCRAWRQHPHGSHRTTQRSRTLLCVLGKRGLLVHERPGASSQRRYCGWLLKPLLIF
jgi:NAD(P)-dependent dehydrogenase (short-subunit alcohol dehydrogenase family)